MQRLTPLAFPVLLSTLLFAAAALAEDNPGLVAGVDSAAVDLRPHFVAGRTSRFEVWTLRQQNITMRLGAESQVAATTMEIRGQVTWRVEKVRPDGGATCTMIMDYMTADLTDPNGEVIHNDTRQPKGDNETIHAVLAAMTQVPLRLDVGPDGNIEKISGTEAVKRKAGKDAPVPEDLDFIESASDLATLCGAPAPLGPGGGWTQPFAWSHEVGTLHQSMRYTLAGVEDIAGIPVATVKGATKLRLEVNRGKLPANVPIEVKLTDGNVETQVMFDLQRHEAVGRNTLETRSITATVRAPVGTITRETRETVQGQVLRIAEE